MVLAVLVGAQAPLPPLPDLPMPPSPAQAPAPELKGLNLPGPTEMKSLPASEYKGFEMPAPKEMHKPAPLVPVNPNGGSAIMPKGGVPTYGNDNVKPPPF